MGRGHESKSHVAKRSNACWLIAAAALAALAALALAPTPATAKTKTKTFKNTSSIAIPDAVETPSSYRAGSAASKLRVGRKGTIKNVKVRVQVTHPNTAELDLYAFNGTTYVPLALGGFGLPPIVFSSGGAGAAGLPSGGADFGGGKACKGAKTVFDGRAERFISEGQNPYAGTFLPALYYVPLSTFKQTQLRGRWRLLVTDSAPGDTGTIECFSVRVKYETRSGSGR